MVIRQGMKVCTELFTWFSKEAEGKKEGQTKAKSNQFLHLATNLLVLVALAFSMTGTRNQGL